MENDLQFERAEFIAPVATPCCACRQPLAVEYFGLNGQMFCGGCADGLRRQLGGTGSRAGRFLRAVLLGVGAAALGGAVYAAVMIFGHSEWAIISIGVGYFVGQAVRRGSGNRGGWRYQLLAAFLTYTAVCAAYATVTYHEMPEPTVTTVIGLVIIAYGIPFLAGAKNILGILIIGFGVYQAWQMNRGIPLEITGPHPLAPGAPTTPAAGA